MEKRVFVQMVNGVYEEVWTADFDTNEVEVLYSEEEKEEVAKNAFRYGDILKDERTEEDGVHTRMTVLELEK